ncbi:hypothetical protein STENM327S_07994 [Streptomyces tendae]
MTTRPGSHHTVRGERVDVLLRQAEAAEYGAGVLAQRRDRLHARRPTGRSRRRQRRDGTGRGGHLVQVPRAASWGWSHTSVSVFTRALATGTASSSPIASVLVSSANRAAIAAPSSSRCASRSALVA